MVWIRSTRQLIQLYKSRHLSLKTMQQFKATKSKSRSKKLKTAGLSTRRKIAKGPSYLASTLQSRIRRLSHIVCWQETILILGQMLLSLTGDRMMKKMMTLLRTCQGTPLRCNPQDLGVRWQPGTIIWTPYSRESHLNSPNKLLLWSLTQRSRKSSSDVGAFSYLLRSSL